MGPLAYGNADVTNVLDGLRDMGAEVSLPQDIVRLPHMSELFPFLRFMLPHIVPGLLLLFLVGGSCGTSSGQETVGDCIPDSVLFDGNARWWYPGEPLTWARPGLLDSLIGMGLDGFQLSVESPRVPKYSKLIRYFNFGPDAEVLFVEGDCRFITYDPVSKTNHSSSIVVGHTYFSFPFWWNGALHFQNGFSNWHVHDHQLWHSRETGEMHQTKLPKSPNQIGFSAVHECDSGLFFTRIDNDFELKQEGQEVYFMHHRRHQWEYLGTLNPVFGNEFSRSVIETKSYWVFSTNTTLLLRRKSDGRGAVIPSAFVAQRNSSESNSISNRGMGWRENTLMNWVGNEVDSVNLDVLAREAQWMPFLIPGTAPRRLDNNPSTLPWWAIVLLSISTALLFILGYQNNQLKKKRTLTIVTSDEMPPLSEETRKLLNFCGQNLDSDDFDSVCGIANVGSPETKRSRRSNIIKMVNAECMARFGAPLIHRERLPSDKRVIIYRMHTFEGIDRG